MNVSEMINIVNAKNKGDNVHRVICQKQTRNNVVFFKITLIACHRLTNLSNQMSKKSLLGQVSVTHRLKESSTSKLRYKNILIQHCNIYFINLELIKVLQCFNQEGDNI